jgi:hypothetical protein
VTCQEDAALELLAWFVSSNLRHYETKRQFADARAVSRLSPYLHSGELGVRRMYHTMAQANARQVGAMRVCNVPPFPFLPKLKHTHVAIPIYEETPRRVLLCFCFLRLFHLRSKLLTVCEFVSQTQRLFDAFAYKCTHIGMVQLGNCI